MNLNEKTSVSLFAALASLPFIIGAIFWLASVDAKATKAAESTEVILEIRDRIIKVEKDVEYLKERK
jgi:hypothetical protein